MIVSVQQPAYLPWLGYFDRIAQSDLHIVLDSVQIEHNTRTSFTNRNRILTVTGPIWLTVPIKRATNNKNRICDVLISDTYWTKKHWRTMQQTYSRAYCYEQAYSLLAPVYQYSWKYLIDLLKETTQRLFEVLEINVPLQYSSQLNVKSRKSDLILDLCREVGATQYLSGPFGRDYLDLASFEHAGIEVIFHDYIHPTYAQVRGEPFIPYMSIVDLLFNCGTKSKEIFKNG